jgi:hypothetical protein
MVTVATAPGHDVAGINRTSSNSTFTVAEPSQHCLAGYPPLLFLVADHDAVPGGRSYWLRPVQQPAARNQYDSGSLAWGWWGVNAREPEARLVDARNSTPHRAFGS